MIDVAGLTRSQDRAVNLVKGVAAAVLASLIVAALYFGRDVFVPIALAILLSFVLGPLVRLLHFFSQISVVYAACMCFGLR